VPGISQCFVKAGFWMMKNLAAKKYLLLTFCLLTLLASGRHAMAESVGSGGQNPVMTLTLRQAIDLARANNEQLQIEREQYRQVIARRNQAWAALLPSVSTGVGHTWTRDIETGGFAIQSAYSRSLSFNAGIYIFRGEAIPNLLAAYKSAEAQLYYYEFSSDAIIFGVADAFVTTLSAADYVNASELRVKLAREHLEAARLRVQMGSARSVDELQAKIELAAATEQLIRAGNARDTSYDTLSFLVGWDEEYRLADPPTFPRPATATGLPLRNDLRAAQLNEDSAAYSHLGAWLTYLPSVFLGYSRSRHVPAGAFRDEYTWSVSLNMEWVLFDGGMREARLCEAISRSREMEIRKRLADRTARLQIDGAWRDLQTGEAANETSQERLQLARQNQQIVRESYMAGLADSLNMLEADQTLADAETSMVATQLDLAKKKLALYQALSLSPLGERLEKE
jgi:outer membrane protein TolC